MQQTNDSAKIVTLFLIVSIAIYITKNALDATFFMLICIAFILDAIYDRMKGE